MRIALASVVTVYALLSLGDWHEAAVVTPMQIFIGLAAIPILLMAFVLLVTSLSKLATPDGRGYELGVLALLMQLLIVLCFKAYRKDQPQRSEAIPVGWHLPVSQSDQIS